VGGKLTQEKSPIFSFLHFNLWSAIA